MNFNKYLDNSKKNIADLLKKINSEIEDNTIIDLSGLKAQKNIGGPHIEVKTNFIDRINKIRSNYDVEVPPPLPPRPNVISDGEDGIKFIKRINFDEDMYRTPPPPEKKEVSPPKLVRKKARWKIIHVNINDSKDEKFKKRKNDYYDFYYQHECLWNFNHVKKMNCEDLYKLYKEKKKEGSVKELVKLIISAKEYEIIQLHEINELQGYHISELLKRIEELENDLKKKD